MLRYSIPLIALYVLSFSQKSSYGQLVVNTNISAQNLAKAIVGKGAVVMNATINCPNGAYGTFTANNTNLGLNSGILLTSGDADKAIGPNSSNSAGKDNNANGDNDLTTLAGSNTKDACILEFDIFHLAIRSPLITYLDRKNMTNMFAQITMTYLLFLLVGLE